MASTPNNYYDKLMEPIGIKNIMYMVSKILLSHPEGIFGYKKIYLNESPKFLNFLAAGE
jgi:hypothetical protein